MTDCSCETQSSETLDASPRDSLVRLEGTKKIPQYTCVFSQVCPLPLSPCLSAFISSCPCPSPSLAHMSSLLLLLLLPSPGAESQRGRKAADQLPQGGGLVPSVEHDGRVRGKQGLPHVSSFLLRRCVSVVCSLASVPCVRRFLCRVFLPLVVLSRVLTM